MTRTGEDNTQFAQVRSLLLQPSERNWKALLSLFERWPQTPMRHTALLYAQEHLEDWPDYLRVYPYLSLEDWKEQLMQRGRSAPWAPFYIACVLCFQCRDYMSLREVNDFLWDLLHEYPLDGLKALNLTSHPLSEHDLDVINTVIFQVHSLSIQLVGDDAFTEFVRLFRSYRPASPMKALFVQGSWHGQEVVKPSYTQEPWYVEHFDQMDKGFRELVQTETFPKLDMLTLQYMKMGIEEIVALVEFKNFQGLQKLALCSNGLGDEEAETLVTFCELSELELLDLSGNNIGDEGAQAIVESDTFGALRALNLQDNNISEDYKDSLKAFDKIIL